MAYVEGKEITNKDEASSGPISSNTQTLNTLKPKSKIYKKFVGINVTGTSEPKDTPPVQGRKKIIKKKVIVVRKKIKNSNDKEGSQAVNPEELKQKNIKNVVESEKSPKNARNKMQNNEKDKDHFGSSENKRLKQNTEDKDDLSKKQHSPRNKEKRQLDGERKEKRNKKIGGAIIFCSAKTKSDCFRYHVMGVATNRKELVLSIKPGDKLFLYDFDAKLLYGIFSASSHGGTKLEPAAFNGSYPFQVRFEIFQDCHPLPESVFKRAIAENYDGKDKLNPELTSHQVNKLMELFQPAKEKEHAPLLYPPRVAIVEREIVKEREREYSAPRHREPLAREPYSYDIGKRYDSHLNEKKDEHLAYRRISPPKRETSPEPLFLSEKDYRTYGLRRERRNISPPRRERDAEKQYPTSYSHLSTESIVDSYLKAPYYGVSNEPYQIPSRKEREEVALGSDSLGRREITYPSEASYMPRRENVDMGRREIYPSQSENYLADASYLGRRENVDMGRRENVDGGRRENVDMVRREIYSSQSEQYLAEASYMGRRENVDGGRRENVDVGSLHSYYASKALSDYNQSRTIERNSPENSLASVSARYSFAGPSRQYL